MNQEAYNSKRVEQNLTALAELKKAAPNPQILQQYTGWGGLRNAVFTPSIYRLLKQQLTDEAITSIKQTMRNAYYTPSPLIQFIYDALVLLNKPFHHILEPSAGHGAFFELMPSELKLAKIEAVEMDEVSCRFIQSLYPTIQLHQGGFETFQPDKKFDLIIGNPPYGENKVMDECHTDLASLRIHHYFIAKSMRLLAPGGILAMVLPHYFLDNDGKNHARAIISQEGGSLLAAYRLPDNLFADAKVTVDVVFLIKEKLPIEWVQVDKQRINGELVSINRYFSTNTAHMIGEVQSIEIRNRPYLTCRAKEDQDTIALLRQQLAYFPPQPALTLEQCKLTLAEKLEWVDKKMQWLTHLKLQLINAQRDLQTMERQCIQQCVQNMALDYSGRILAH